MNDTHMTRQDLINLKRSMKDPKFKELLGDYMMEISDPKNKGEADAYLRQLETEGELPKGMKLIQPAAFLCMASRIASEDDKRYTQKIYINICTHEDVERAHPGESSSGRSSWQVPYFLGKQRYDQDGDQDKEIVCVIDIVFSSNVTQLCAQIRGFQKMLCDISFEGVSKVLAAKKERLDPDYSLVKQAKCKGAEPAVMPIRDPGYTGPRPAGGQEEKPKLYHEINKMKEEAQKGGQSAAATEGVASETDTPSQEPESVRPDGPTPQYSFAYVYQTDSDDFIDSTFKNAKQVSKLKLKVCLPKVTDTKQLKCDFDGETVTLEYLDVYYLNLRLPITVLRDTYKAKFDKSRKELNLEFQPVKRAVINARPVECETAQVDEEGGQLQVGSDEGPETTVSQSDATIATESPRMQADPVKPSNDSEASQDPDAARSQVTVPSTPQPSETTENPQASLVAELEPQTLPTDQTGDTAISSGQPPVEPSPKPITFGHKKLEIFNRQLVDNKTFIQLRTDHLGETGTRVMYSDTKLIVLPNEVEYFAAEVSGFVPGCLTVRCLEGFLVLVFKHGGSEFGLEAVDEPDLIRTLSGMQRLDIGKPEPKTSPKPADPEDKENQSAATK
jgi:hypothetical protein